MQSTQQLKSGKIIHFPLASTCAQTIHRSPSDNCLCSNSLIQNSLSCLTAVSRSEPLTWARISSQLWEECSTQSQNKVHKSGHRIKFCISGLGSIFSKTDYRFFILWLLLNAGNLSRLLKCKYPVKGNILLLKSSTWYSTEDEQKCSRSAFIFQNLKPGRKGIKIIGS